MEWINDGESCARYFCIGFDSNASRLHQAFQLDWMLEHFVCSASDFPKLCMTLQFGDVMLKICVIHLKCLKELNEIVMNDIKVVLSNLTWIWKHNCAMCNHNNQMYSESEFQTQSKQYDIKYPLRRIKQNVFFKLTFSSALALNEAKLIDGWVQDLRYKRKRFS